MRFLLGLKDETHKSFYPPLGRCFPPEKKRTLSSAELQDSLEDEHVSITSLYRHDVVSLNHQPNRILAGLISLTKTISTGTI